jgi:hypothetical protein
LDGLEIAEDCRFFLFANDWHGHCVIAYKVSGHKGLFSLLLSAVQAVRSPHRLLREPKELPNHIWSATNLVRPNDMPNGFDSEKFYSRRTNHAAFFYALKATLDG